MMQWSDFLNPRSMMTPGVAGSLVMVIANTLWVQFMLPQKWTALILSFLLIVPILMQFSASIVESLVYFFINGLIIFSLAVNANVAGGRLQELTMPGPVSAPAHAEAQMNSAISLAMSSTATMPAGTVQLAQNDENDKEKKKESSGSGNNDKDSNKKGQKGQKGNPEFFGNWF